MKIRNCVKIILLNEHNEIPLMLEENPNVFTIDGNPSGAFYTLIGGGIEPGESMYEAAVRELYEESGITKAEVEFGPVVWIGEFEIILYGQRTHFKMNYIVAKTKNSALSLANLTETEKIFVKEISWFSLEKIRKTRKPIYPLLLEKHLPDIIAGKYPSKPIIVNLLSKRQKNI